MAKKKQATEEKEMITWTCEKCEGNPTFEHADFIKHAAEVHSLPKDAKGQRTMLMHMDGTKWFASSYRWEFADFSAVQSIRTPRTGEDAAFWEAMG